MGELSDNTFIVGSGVSATIVGDHAVRVEIDRVFAIMHPDKGAHVHINLPQLEAFADWIKERARVLRDETLKRHEEEVAARRAAEVKCRGCSARISAETAKLTSGLCFTCRAK